LDSDDEDDDTVETRRSVKTAEKMHKTRFFINAKDRRDYEKKVIEGRISQEELDFAEGKDHEIGTDPNEAAAKEAAKKEAVLKEAKEAELEKSKTPGQKKLEEETKQLEAEDAAAAKEQEKSVAEKSPAVEAKKSEEASAAKDQKKAEETKAAAPVPELAGIPELQA
jgi:hypothetical protein